MRRTVRGVSADASRGTRDLRGVFAFRVHAVLDVAQARGRVGRTATLATVAAAAVLLVVLAPVTVVARRLAPQNQTLPSFEVASIKVNRSGSLEQLGGFQPGGRFRAGNVPLRQIIAWAYGDAFPVVDQQIVGGPSWLNSDRFDIDARAQGDPSRSDLQLMLRAMLRDRFQLVSHEETRELPVYHLTRSGRPGRALKASQGDDCIRPGASAPPGANLPPCGNVGFIRGRGFGRSVTMDAVARYLTPAVGRIVINRTNLEGTFTFDVMFAPTLAASAGADVADQPSIFTALQEELGMTLSATRDSIAVLVVDGVERPSEN